MKKKEKDGNIGATTKIKEAAHDLFLQKGFSATTIREIAEKAGTNVALLNYYFGTKKQLFEVVILEKIQSLLVKVVPIFSDKNTSFEQKIEAFVDTYIDFLLADPDLITFIINEIRKNNVDFIAKTQVRELVHQSFFMKQLQDVAIPINPIQLLLSIASMIVFPFVAMPLIIQTKLSNKKEFYQMMQERKKLIPIWVKSMITSNTL